MFDKNLIILKHLKIGQDNSTEKIQISHCSYTCFQFENHKFMCLMGHIGPIKVKRIELMPLGMIALISVSESEK